MTAAFERLKAAIAKEAEIERQAEEHKAQAADLEYGAECDEAKAAQFEADSEKIAAEAALAGKAILGRDDAKVANLRRKTKAKRAAAEKARNLAGEVAADLPAARDSVISASLSFMRTSRDSARTDLLNVLSSAGEALAQMIASEFVRESLIGGKYCFDPEEHDPAELWSGATLAENLIKGMPPRLRPDDFLQNTRNRAEEIAADQLRKLRGTRE